jgi:mannose-6-phosphate isomerase-like protein (cupin superfamily)
MIVVERLAPCFAGLRDYWEPVIVARPNDHLVKAIRVLGEFNWHINQADDKTIVVWRGELIVHAHKHAYHLGEGDVITIPRGTAHRIVAIRECHVLLVELDASSLNPIQMDGDVYSGPYASL